MSDSYYYHYSSPLRGHLQGPSLPLKQPQLCSILQKSGRAPAGWRAGSSPPTWQSWLAASCWPTHSHTYLDFGEGLAGSLGGRLVPPGQRGTEPLDLTEVDEEGTLGAVHPEEGIAGVRGPAGTHPLWRGPAWAKEPAPAPCAPSVSPCMHVPGDPEVSQDRVSGAHPKDAARLEAEKRDWTGALGPSPVSWLLRASGKARQDHHPPGPEREGPWGNEASPGHMRPRFQGQQWRCSSSGPGWSLFLCPPPVTKSRVQLKPRSGSSL